MCIRDSQEDWETGWKAYYHAMDIGTRLAVVPSWEAYETDRAVITLDPGMAFGTGTHETTALCLETPVSYTHLDVYKRQVYRRRPWRPASGTSPLLW